ncbi:unnamed protein product [Clonostachys rosea]|uniref:Major facilitator superfamily (MFS) profile domain-containing protein n=1 Tax=Bionectria ochroleuca TaxID=29856 RepID=A0ABY6U5K5_BIOOC|nr:unnamed protein product [Clonostachys rosea]
MNVPSNPAGAEYHNVELTVNPSRHIDGSPNAVDLKRDDMIKESPSPVVSVPSLVPVNQDCRPVATEEEIATLLHVVDDIPSRTWIACLVGACERFVWFAGTMPLQNYIQNAPGGAVPGALGLGQATASNIVNALMISSYVTPIPAAILADSGHGRYRTLVWSCIIEAIGATILAATSWSGAFEAGAALPGMIVALVFLSFGSGAFKTAVIPFIVDQYEETEFRVKALKSGEKVVMSRELTITYIYNAFFWAENVVAIVTVATPVLERYVNFFAAYLVPGVVMWLILIPLLLAKRKFANTKTVEENVIPQVARALWFGVTSGFQMDAAKPAVQLDRKRRAVPWTDSFIDDIKTSLLTCRVLLIFPVYWLCFNQAFNNLISQAGQMITYGIPNDVIMVTGAIAGVFVGPLVQYGLYPFLTRRRIRFGPVARITFGFGILTISMAYIVIVQHLIYRTGPCYDHPLNCAVGRNIPNKISVFLQLPFYFLSELASVFCCTTGTEYAYNRAPKSMKTLVQAIWNLMAGIGSVLALPLSQLAQDPRLVIMYGVLTGLMGVGTVLTWVIFGHLDKEATAML